MLQGDGRRYAMASLALQGSLTMITYLGPNIVAESVKNLSKSFRWWSNLGLCSWWTLQAAGVPFSAYARSLLELWLLQILFRLGVLGAFRTWFWLFMSWCWPFLNDLPSILSLQVSTYSSYSSSTWHSTSKIMLFSWCCWYVLRLFTLPLSLGYAS
jgi:hypothetical protein